ncbi:MAG TPA: UDP-N-acetylglucosamine 2-epimerase (non-hydrolyzing) [Bacillota bacterium]
MIKGDGALGHARKKILAIFGTRPEAIKMAPLVISLREQTENFDLRVLVTAQHREMLDQVLTLFRIKPDYDLNIMTEGQALTEIMIQALQGITPVLWKEAPDLVLVHGDTSTTLAGALAAYYQQIPVAHVEAGLRTYRSYSPFPEEMNRRLTGALAEDHFAPTVRAKQNLVREGIRPERIMVTGNTVIDALLSVASRPDLALPDEMRRIPLSRRVIVVTTHRRENLDGGLRQVYLGIKDLVQEFPDVEVVFPIHLNPKVRTEACSVLGDLPRVHLLEPLTYERFVALLRRAFLVLTDSGGIQEEAPALGKPVLVLRDTTERPEAVAAGTVRLIGTEREKVYRETRNLLCNKQAYLQMANARNPYGDGQAARRITDYLLWKYGFLHRKPEEFEV